MNKTTIITGIIFLLFTFQVFGQQTTAFTEANLDFKNGQNFYDQGLFGQSMQEFLKVLQKLAPVNDPESDLLRMKAELNKAKSAVRLDLPDGEKLMLEFIRKYRPDPMANKALIDVADYYFNARKYDKAVEFYQLVPTYQLASSDKAEVKFKMGYAHFVQKEFKEAKTHFYHLRQLNNSEYREKSNYYYGLCEFFEGNYSQAIGAFKIAEKDPRYAKHIPYYLAQIYFAQKNYDELIRSVEPRLKTSGLKNQAELHGLVGQAYFEKANYSKALFHLEKYAAGSNKLREEEFYQLGYTQYKTNNFKEAIINLKELSRSNTPLGQQAMHLLGDSYLKTGNKENARNAFRIASRMDFDIGTREDAIINYAKLSYELKKDSDALEALQSIRSSSRHYGEAQALMSDLFLNSRDYARALELIEKMPNKTPQIREAYQKVAYLRALELIKIGDSPKARTLLQKSLQVPVNQEYKALATFWNGRIAYDEKDYSSAIQYLKQYEMMSRGINNFPTEASPYMASYIMGYSYLKQKQFTTAGGYFQEAVAGIKRNQAYITNTYVKNDVLGDALLRAGDGFFKKNNYDSAIKFYDEAINGKYKDYVYALYQKAIIQGLRGKQTEQIIALERITKDHSSSEYADDALLKLGRVYAGIGKSSQASEPLKKLVKNYRNSELVCQALIKLGLISYGTGNNRVAINYYKQVFSHNPTEEEANSALKALKEIYVDDLGQPDEYFAFLETVPGYKVSSDEKESLNLQAAETQFYNENYAKAIQGYNAYINKFPNGANRMLAQFHRAQSYYGLKQYSKALKDFEWVINKGSSRYYFTSLERAALISYNSEKDFAAAYNYYILMEKNAQTDEQRFDGQLGAMRSAYRSNNQSAAISLAKKVANNPRADNDQRATANMYIGKHAMDNRDYPTAMQSFNKVISSGLDNESVAESRYQVAYIHYIERDLNKALESAQQSQGASSSFPYWQAKSAILMADIYAEQGEFLNAQAILEVVINRFKDNPEIYNEAKSKKEKLDRMIDAQSRLDTSDPGSPLELIDGN